MVEERESITSTKESIAKMDREKVLTWLEICGKNNDCSGCCPYSENGFGEYGQCRESLMADAYDLLKEQEAVEPFHRCIGNSHTLIEDSGFNYCPYCGKPIVDTEGR